MSIIKRVNVKYKTYDDFGKQRISLKFSKFDEFYSFQSNASFETRSVVFYYKN